MAASTLDRVHGAAVKTDSECDPTIRITIPASSGVADVIGPEMESIS